MKINSIATLIFIANIVNAQTHDHRSDQNKKNTKKIELKNQFIPTADLKVRMEKILTLIEEINPNKDNVKIVKAYGDKLTEVVNDIIKTCKLEPEADEAIHPSLGLIFEGASDFKNGKFERGQKKIHEALLDYEKMFKHDGWKH